MERLKKCCFGALFYKIFAPDLRLEYGFIGFLLRVGKGSEAKDYRFRYWTWRTSSSPYWIAFAMRAPDLLTTLSFRAISFCFS